MSTTFYISTSDESLALYSWDTQQFKYLWQVRNPSENAEIPNYYDHNCLKIMPQKVKLGCKSCEKIYFPEFG